MGALTTHVLDTAIGLPAAGLRLSLRRVNGERSEEIHTVRTNRDGRCDQPLLEGNDLLPGVYELVFQAGEYFAGRGVKPDGSPPFLDEVVLRFGVSQPERHYHVPLLLSPYGYTTYRGS